MPKKDQTPRTPARKSTRKTVTPKPTRIAGRVETYRGLEWE
jgi:hypothetical protein